MKKGEGDRNTNIIHVT